ncbi:13591_t:CDS:2, partial [Funneliformis caledonium]
MAKRRKSSSSITYKPETFTKEYNSVFQKSINERNYNFSLKKSNNNSNIQIEVDEKILASILARVTALEMKTSSEQKSDDARDCESNTIDKDHDNLSIALPIPKPSGKSSKFANLHLKLNLEKNVTFYRLNECHTPVKIQYKNLDKNIRAGIIHKFKKANPYFSDCISDWALVYLMRHKININQNAYRWDKKCYIENKVQSMVKSAEGRINQPL